MRRTKIVCTMGPNTDKKTNTVKEMDKIAAAHFITLFNETFFIPSIMVKYRSNPFSPVL